MQLTTVLASLVFASTAYTADGSTIIDGLELFLGDTNEFGLFISLLQAIPTQDITDFASLITDNITIAIPESAPNGTVSQLLGNTDEITPLLSYHLIRDQVTNSSVATSPGHTIVTTAMNNNSMVLLQNNQAQSLVLTADSNGIIHILNQPTDVILTPRSSFSIASVSYAWANISELLVVPTSLSTTLPAMNASTFSLDASRTQVLDTYENTPGITLFIPQDSAFASVNSTLNSLNSTELVSVLNGHVINGTYYSPQFTGGQTQANFAGQTLTINGTTVSLQDGNTANILTSDVLLNNGVAHIVDNVLLLDSVKKSSAAPVMVPTAKWGVALTMLFTLVVSVL